MLLSFVERFSDHRRSAIIRIPRIHACRLFLPRIRTAPMPHGGTQSRRTETVRCQRARYLLGVLKQAVQRVAHGETSAAWGTL